ncbi:MAG: bicyclomycin resistance protein [Burkholderiales bacterium]|nr:bicyclomycin resistance protein [Burkholderiales bacterium]
MRLRLLVATCAAACALASGTAFAQADPAKVLRVAFLIAETGFDPQASSDVYSNYVNRVIFDPLFRYDYVSRPHRIVPNTAAAMPEISKDGLTWTIRVKPGTYFADDPAFRGKKRELTAADYLYSWKRTLDPKMRSPQLDLFDRKIVGMDALLVKAKAGGRLDYDAPVEGMQLVDRYTLRLKLTYPSYDMLADLTTTGAAAVAREVVEAYGDTSGWVMANPVGTGPYRLAEWRRGQRIVLEASPSFRDVRYPESDSPAAAPLLAKFGGKRIPFIGKIEISIIEEANPRLQAFEKADLDYIEVPVDLVANVMEPGNRLKPRFTKAGVVLQRGIIPGITFTWFNMEDPVVGGYTREKIALRRAIGMAYNVDEEARVIRQGQAEWASQVIPPGVSGHDPKFTGNTRFDPQAAKALLDRFGYVDRDGDGWRDLPDGKPLVLRKGTVPSALERQYDELWKRNMTAVGLKIEFVTQKWPDLLKMARGGSLQMWQLGNRSTTTEGYGFLGLLYGPNAGLANLARFHQPDYDRAYDASKKLPDGPERAKLMRQMSEIVAAYAPWKINAYRYENIVLYPWVHGYQLDVFNIHPWQYLDVDMKSPRIPVQ